MTTQYESFQSFFRVCGLFLGFWKFPSLAKPWKKGHLSQRIMLIPVLLNDELGKALAAEGFRRNTEMYLLKYKD